jgi:hypothetical protein
LRRIARDPIILHAMGTIGHGVPDATSPRGGGEWTVAAVGTRHVRYQAMRARRAAGAGCPVSASRPNYPRSTIRDREWANSQAAHHFTGPTPRCQDNSVLNETWTVLRGVHS